MGLDLFDLTWMGSGSLAGSGPASDRHVLRAIRDTLDALDIFDHVGRGNPPEKGSQSADRFAVCYVLGADWDEQTFADDDDETQYLRNARFTLLLVVRQPDPAVREDVLDVLRAACANAINYQCFAGITIPGETRLGKGQYLPPDPPEQTMRITGEFSYFVDGPTQSDSSRSD